MRVIDRLTSPMIARVFAAGCLCLLLGACGASLDSEDGNRKVNGSIHVTVGRAPADVRTVNGAIRVDANAQVSGATTVNGSVSLGAHAQGGALQTVNGDISLDGGAHAAEAKTVNGTVDLKPGAEVSGSLVNVSGKISVTGAHVGGIIRTVAGDVTLSGATKVDGGIVVEKTGSPFHGDDPTIIIGPGVTVGDLQFERKVRLYVSDKATTGHISGATAVTFSGDNPSNAT